MPIASGVIGKMSRSIGKWANFIGGGGTFYYAGGADGLAGSAIKYSNGNGYAGVLGYGGGNIVTQFGVRNGNNYDYPFYKMYNASTAVQSTLAGYNGTSVAGNAWCANGTSLISCIIPQNDNGYAVPYGPIYDSTDGSWLMRSYLPSDISVRKILPGGTMQTYFSTTGTIKGMALNKGSSPTHEYFYYCDNSVYPSKIKKVDMINSPTAPVALAWPITSVVCDGNNMVYSASRNSLIFIYKQNGLYGVIEYLNP